jgi:NAD(P)-dependent dehydrogenase (short-subunit alcohol dehydrogenase family)
MPKLLSGKVVLISGATGSLGSAVARTFAHTGARLVLTSRSADGLEQLVAVMGLPADDVMTLAADVTQPESVEHLVGAVVERMGAVDVLLNTVGGWSGGKTVGETTIEDWERMIALNLYSAFLLSRQVLPCMLEAGWGRIVHISSKVAVQPRAKQVAHNVSKMGVIALTEAIALETKGTGVTANVILPSIIDTLPNREMMPKSNPSRWVKPEEIAAMMHFLCSEAGAAINGARIPMYGAV